MEIVLAISYTALFIYLIFKLSFFRIHGLPRKFITGVFFLKLLCGLALAFLYKYHYPEPEKYADTIKYFNDSKVLYELIYTDPLAFFELLFTVNNESILHLEYYLHLMDWWTFESQTIIKVNALMRIFSGGFYFVHVVFFVFLSLIGLVAFYKFLNKVIPGHLLCKYVSVFFVPSVLFWGSGALKEGVFIFANGVFFYSLYEILTKRATLLRLLTCILGLYLLMFNQYYLVALLVPCLVAFVITTYANPKRVGWFFSAISIGYWLIVLNAYRIFPKYDFIKSLYKKQQHFIGYTSDVDVASLIDYKVLKPTFLSLVECTPTAFFNSILRPHIMEIKNALMLMAALENMLYIILFMAIIISFNKARFRRLFRFPIIQFSIYFSVLLFLLIGLVVPVAGAIVRYKVPLLIYWTFVLMMMVDPQKLSARIGVLKPIISYFYKIEVKLKKGTFSH
ncbi:MAG: hypothetical protein COC01_10325 [Bacteroidetes bacterium]|nr:hypothetical protein [Bacteroidia bacterium]PCH65120.1 MAG: hypothetical protein COC01_10325 [Bacteroidota bacterium]